ncbi:MAG: GNAT family N-acetyltransferase [Candidatus Eisenbacteria bacterium]|nr:GNAT family N-acetyltransferase [Candidatus Eisenbacteria bacterium]
MGETADPRIQIRPFADRRDCERMVDYFLNADKAFLEGMGVDPGKLPPRREWIESALLDLERPAHEKDRYYLAWIYDGTPVGHASINRIKVGEEAFIHLHLWVKDLRKAGLGTQFFAASAVEFMRAFRLKRLFCEPYAENPAPNRVVLKAGFRFVKRYRTTPGPLNFEQDVNQYVRENPEALAG